jgi:dTMP kinase
MKAKKPGLIVYFDGPDGVGKTTQLKLVADKLRQGPRQAHVTRTLGGTHIGEMLRDVILSDTDRPVETDLHIALASQYALAGDLQVRRDEGQVVLIDRSPLSILAYQVYGDKLDREVGYGAITELLDLIKPDLLITYLTSDEEIAKRRSHRHRELSDDFFENKPQSYHKRVAKGFREAAEHFNTTVLDASQPIEQVHQTTMQLLQKYL